MATRQKRQRLHQSAVPGAIEVVQDLEDLTHALSNARQTEKESRKESDEAHEALMVAMRRHSKTVYRTASGLLATFKPGKDKVKVTKASETGRKRK